MKRNFDINGLFGEMAKPTPTTFVPPKVHVVDEKTVKAMTWQIDITVLDRLHVFAKSHSLKKNALVERAIIDYLDAHED